MFSKTLPSILLYIQQTRIQNPFQRLGKEVISWEVNTFTKKSIFSLEVNTFTKKSILDVGKSSQYVVA